jgi:hypothetical protein
MEYMEYLKLINLFSLRICHKSREELNEIEKQRFLIMTISLYDLINKQNTKIEQSNSILENSFGCK